MRPELLRILGDLPGLPAVLERAAERFVQLSRLGGTVEVAREERRSVERLGCRVDARGRVKLTELDRAFRVSRLEAPLPDVLEEYLGRSLVTRAESREREDTAWQDLMERLGAASPPEWAQRWLHDEEGSLRAEWRRQGDAWPSALEEVLRAAAARATVGEGTELPRLAYLACGDAHGLDSDRAAGRLFERLLIHRLEGAGFTLPLSAEDRESLFAMAGLAIDEISSTVHVVGLDGIAPLVAAARAGRHVLVLPIRTLYAIQADIRAHRNVVFAVENRSVFSALHRGLADVQVEKYPTLVCTSGHLSLATLRLLDRLTAQGAVVRYSGDFDAKGLMIADALAARLGAAFEPWRMGPEAFQYALGGRRPDDRRRATTHRVDPGPFGRGATARFPALVRVIEARGAAFQEGLAEVLVGDVRRWIAEG